MNIWDLSIIIFRMKYFLLFSSLLLTTACSSIYYYPIKNQYYVEAEKLKPTPETVRFKSTDGTELEAWYFKSETKKPKALILHFHGNAQNISTHFGFLWDSVKLGYDYFIFDYRGYGRSQGEPTPAGVVEDGISALVWAQAKAEERKIPLIVFCQSLGGAICMKSLSYKNDVNPKALVIDSSFSSYRSEARTVAASSWILWLFQPLAWLIADNSQAPQEDLPYLKAQNFLVVHGEEDHVVDIQHGKKIFEKLPEPKEFWIIPNGVHTDFLVRPDKEYAIKFYAWLERILK